MAPIRPAETNAKPEPGRLAAFYSSSDSAKTRIIVDIRSDKSQVNKYKSLLEGSGEKPDIVDVTDQSAETIALFLRSIDRKSLPIALVKGDAVDLDVLTKLNETGALKEWLQPHDYDLVVVGGGSGGLAAAKEAAAAGKKVACLDFVQPTPIGTSWGLGGTCVNVGCIPKKLMHQAAILGHSVDDAVRYGWQVPGGVHHKDDANMAGPIKHDWSKMRNAIQDYIASLNWGYRVQLREKSVNYINSYGHFVNSHTIIAKNKRGKEEKITADRFLIATGLRPKYPGTPGDREHCITSDDLFSLTTHPGKTLLVGASYIALECAGFLNGLGYDTTVMVRSILLRGFDQDMAERIGTHMTEQGVKFIRPCVPDKFEKTEPGRVKVTATMQNGEKVVDEYDTVVLAIGREARVDDVNLDAANIRISRKSKKVITRRNEQSITAPWVYAVGDVMEGGLELTPVAIQAGRFLMRRLYEHKDQMVDYKNVPTTVFCPLEYGACGMSEDEAISILGEDNIDVYHNVFNPLEHTVAASKDAKHCYAKMITIRQGHKKGRVLGLHYLGPNAGEVMQGFGIAFQFKARKEHFDQLVGIHPTTAEIFTSMTVTKREQSVMQATGC